MTQPFSTLAANRSAYNTDLACTAYVPARSAAF
jgi:hypothetical protein